MEMVNHGAKVNKVNKVNRVNRVNPDSPVDFVIPAKAGIQFLRFSLASFILLTPLTFPLWAGYLESRHWGGASQVRGVSQQALGSDFLDRHPFLWPKGRRWIIEESLGWESILTRGARSKEPFWRHSQNRLIPLGLPKVTIQPWVRPFWICVSGQDGFVQKSQAERVLYAAGVSNGRLAYQDRWAAPWIELAARGALEPDGLGAEFSWRQARGRRSLGLISEDVAGRPLWNFEETFTFNANAFRLGFFGRMARRGLWALAWESPEVFQGTNEMVYSSSSSALTPATLALPGRVQLGAAWQAWAAWIGADGKIFWGQIDWVRSSKIRVDGRPGDQGGAGLFWDTEIFQKQVLGNAALTYPSYQDRLGLQFGIERPLSARTRLLLSSQFWTSEADPRVVEPMLGIGLRATLGSSWQAQAALAFSAKDYFGDGLFWPKDQRLYETTLLSVIRIIAEF